VHATLAERFALMMPPNALLEDDFRDGLDLTGTWALVSRTPSFVADDGVVSSTAGCRPLKQGSYPSSRRTRSRRRSPAARTSLARVPNCGSSVLRLRALTRADDPQRRLLSIQGDIDVNHGRTAYGR
jgi:hypothetical protein